MGIALPDQPNYAPGRRLRCIVLLIISSLMVTVTWAQTPLSLPFFDDFSTSSAQAGRDRPAPARWEPGSGVYINNTMAINHPTVGVATFDGLRANNQQYVQNNQLAQGYTDTLQSRPVTLAGLSAADSVYLSFYWQIRGLGESPDPGDSLTLQFLDRTGAWQTVWRVEGGAPNNNFPQVFVPVRDTRYFHAGFAFRFRSYGRASGPFDTWNVDYVYLNRGRTRADRFVKDVAMRQAISPLLRRYTAMPLAQYAVNPAGEVADSVTTDINNLFNTFNFTTLRFSIRDELTGQVLQNDPSTASELIQALSSQRKRAVPRLAGGFGSATRASLRYTFDLLTTDDQNPSIPGVNLRRNDTLSAVATLDDYYAYDDGSWEFARQIGPREQVAVRFILNKPDVIAGVRMCLVPIRINQSGQPFTINIYNNRNGLPGQVIYRKSFATQYPTTRNGFVTFPFDRGISVTDTFYVGYQQITASDTTQLRIGFDKGSLFGSQIFYNGGTSWAQNQQSSALDVQGAFMIRPVMGGRPDTVVTALPEPIPASSLSVYPNPTTGLIRWDHTQLRRLEILNPSGRLLVVVEPSRGQQTLDIGHLTAGLYLIRLSDGQRTVVQKLIVQQ